MSHADWNVHREDSRKGGKGTVGEKVEGVWEGGREGVSVGGRERGSVGGSVGGREGE